MKEITNMEELRMAQMELEHRIALKEMELGAHANSIKEMLNPLTYINYALSKVAVVEQLAASFIKGFTTVRDFIAQYRKNNIPDNNPNNNPDNNQ